MKRIAVLLAGICLWSAVGVAAQETVVAPESLVVDGACLRFPRASQKRQGDTVSIEARHWPIGSPENGAC
jgi:hypothetical protein